MPLEEDQQKIAAARASAYARRAAREQQARALDFALLSQVPPRLATHLHMHTHARTCHVRAHMHRHRVRHTCMHMQGGAVAAPLSGRRWWRSSSARHHLARRPTCTACPTTQHTYCTAHLLAHSTPTKPHTHCVHTASLREVSSQRAHSCRRSSSRRCAQMRWP